MYSIGQKYFAIKKKYSREEQTPSNSGLGIILYQGRQVTLATHVGIVFGVAFMMDNYLRTDPSSTVLGFMSCVEF